MKCTKCNGDLNTGYTCIICGKNNNPYGSAQAIDYKESQPAKKDCRCADWHQALKKQRCITADLRKALEEIGTFLGKDINKYMLDTKACNHLREIVANTLKEDA